MNIKKFKKYMLLAPSFLGLVSLALSWFAHGELSKHPVDENFLWWYAWGICIKLLATVVFQAWLVIYMCKLEDAFCIYKSNDADKRGQDDE